MKNFAKKLALFLALALTLTLVEATPISVEAASKITLKSGAAAPASVYAGHSYTLKVAGTSVKFFSSNKAVATIGMSTGKFKPVAPGTVKVTAKSKKTGKTVATKSFTVLQRATAVASDPSELYLGAVGDTATLAATKTPATSTDVVKFFSADKTIATVGMTSGKVTAKAEGTTTVSVYAMATKATSKSSKYNKVATVNVYVGPYMASAVQQTATDIALTFKADMKDVKATDFTVTNDATKVTYPVKSATVSNTDAKNVTISTYASLNDGGSYTVAYAKTSAQFKATDGVIASLSITPTTVTIAKETKIYVVAKDANGIEVARYDQGSLPSNFELSIDTTDGYVTGEGALYLSTKTSTAKASAKYHTWKYEDNKEVGLLETGDVTITATEAESINTSGFTYTIAKSVPNFSSSSYKQSTELCVGDTGYAAYLKIADASNSEISNYGDYTIESSNEDVLLVTSNLSSNSKFVGVAGIKAGTAYLVVKNTSTKAVVTTLPVTVKAARTATSFVLDKSSADLSNAVGMQGDATQIGYKVLDQYGQNMNEVEENEIVISAKSQPSGVSKETAEAALAVAVGEGVLTANVNGLKAGQYIYGVQYKSLAVKMFTITVREPSASGAYTFDVKHSTDKIDNAVSTATAEPANKEVTLTPILKKGGAAYETIGMPSDDFDGANDVYSRVDVQLTVKNSANKDVSDKYLDGTVFKIVEYNDKKAYVTPADVYTFTYKFTATKKSNNEKVITTINKKLEVTNSMAELSFARVSNTYKEPFTIEDGKITNLDEVLNACYTFNYDGSTYGKNGDYLIAGAEAETVYVSDTNIVLKTVTLYIPLTDALSVQMTVDVSASGSVKYQA